MRKFREICVAPLTTNSGYAAESDHHYSLECGAQSLVDMEGMEAIQTEAEMAKNAALDGNWENSTYYWASTEWAVIEETHGVDFYNIHKFNDYWSDSLSDKPELQLMLTADSSSKSQKIISIRNILFLP